MSNYPPTPSFGGSDTSTQQWRYQRTPADNGSSVPSYPTHSSFFDSSTTAGLQPAHYAVSSSYSHPSLTLGSQLPGLTMTNSNGLAQPFAPIDLPGQFTNDFSWPQPGTTYQTSPSWIPPSVSNLHTSALPNTSFPPTAPLFRDLGQRDIPDTTKILDDHSAEISFDDDIDREEGEVSEGDHEDVVNGPTDLSHHSRQEFSSRLRSEGDVALNFDKPSMPTRRSHKKLSNRLSGNPQAEQAQQLLSATSSMRAGEHGVKEPTGKNPAQMRLLAHGALLSLAAHNIRFHDLVKENINPVILRHLYEEIGVKVPAIDPHSQEGTETAISAHDDLELNMTDLSHAQDQANAANGLTTTTKSPQPHKPPVEVTGPDMTQRLSTEKSAARQTGVSGDTAKPLERKDVIAQMLAAKSKKPTIVPPKKKTDVSTLPPATTDHLIEQKQNEVTKEKNKAQTELARQRMEQFKKGLHKLKQRTPTTTNPSNIQDQDGPSVERDMATFLQHPLPNRPPAIESPPTSRIPGLFMTGTEFTADLQPTKSSNKTAEHSHVTAPSLHRKRPRASDFDDIVPTSKKAFSSEDRLVIDISEDESMYGDDERGETTVFSGSTHILRNDSTPSSEANNLSASDSSLNNSEKISLHRLKSSSSQRGSNRPSDPEDLRQKNLEILAMRKRIAELELKKKARLATSRTHSPGTPIATPSASYPEESHEPVRPADEFPVSVASDILASAVEECQDAPSTTNDSSRSNSIASPPSQINGSPSQLDPSSHGELFKVNEMHAERKANQEAGRDELAEELGGRVTERASLSLEEPRVTEPIQSPRPLFETGEDRDLATTTTVDNVPNEKTTIPGAPDLPVAGTSGPNESDQLTMFPNESETRSESTSMKSSQVSGENEASSSDEGKGQETASDSAMDESLDSVRSMSLDSSTQLVSSALEQNPNQEDAVISSQNEAIFRQGTGGKEPHEKEDIVSGDSFDVISQMDEIVSDAGSNEPSDSSAASDFYEPPDTMDPSATEPHQMTSPPTSFPSSIPQLSDQVGFEHNTKVSTMLSEADRGLTGITQELKDVERRQIDILENVRHPLSVESTYTPYISPLKLFKAYRFHPSYLKDTSRGYRSLTYSHNVDPWKPLCPFEASGGVCNDHSCGYQHWRDMELSDDNILIQMGSIREGQTPEEQHSYLEGLKTMINDMQRDKVNDFETVAAEIAAYRRRYLEDPSRILSL